MWQSFSKYKWLLIICGILAVFGTPVTLRLIERNEHITIERMRNEFSKPTEVKDTNKVIYAGLGNEANEKDTRSLVNQYFNIKETAEMPEQKQTGE